MTNLNTAIWHWLCPCVIFPHMSVLSKPSNRITPILLELPSSFLWMLVVMETGQHYLINIGFRVKLGLIRLNVSLSAHFCASLLHKSNSLHSLLLAHSYLDIKAEIHIYHSLFCFMWPATRLLTVHIKSINSLKYMEVGKVHSFVVSSEKG